MTFCFRLQHPFLNTQPGIPVLQWEDLIANILSTFCHCASHTVSQKLFSSVTHFLSGSLVLLIFCLVYSSAPHLNASQPDLNFVVVSSGHPSFSTPGKMSHQSTLDLDRYSSLETSRRSTSRSQPRAQAKRGEVLCDFCTTRRQKAEKSCLVCLASYCETHLQSHYEYPAMMKHKLVRATGQMREKICAQHDKLLEAFCRTDQTSVCVLCMMDEHKHHDIVPAGTERTEKQVSHSTFWWGYSMGELIIYCQLLEADMSSATVDLECFCPIMMMSIPL